MNSMKKLLYTRDEFIYISSAVFEKLPAIPRAPKRLRGLHRNDGCHLANRRLPGGASVTRHALIGQLRGGSRPIIASTKAINTIAAIFPTLLLFPTLSLLLSHSNSYGTEMPQNARASP